MISYHCDECNHRTVTYNIELDCFYCFVCENYCNARAKRWD